MGHAHAVTHNQIVSEGEKICMIIHEITILSILLHVFVLKIKYIFDCNFLLYNIQLSPLTSGLSVPYTSAQVWKTECV